MGKHLTKSRVAEYGLLFAAAGISAWSLSYARFTVQTDGTAATSVTAQGNNSTTIDIHVNGLRPGKTRDYIFPVTNMGDEMISEAEQNYSIEMETAGNLPLKFTFTPEISDSSHDGTFAEIGESGKLTLNNGMAVIKGGYLPHFVSAIHVYALAVIWLREQTGTGYADEIDLATLTISSGQTILAEQQ